MFGTNFLSLLQFATSDPLFFWSPFLGILSALMAQLFLLRRIVRFLSSLAMLWPILARRAVRYSFIVCMVMGMLLAAVSGAKASSAVAGTGGLARLASGSGQSEESVTSSSFVPADEIDSRSSPQYGWVQPSQSTSYYARYFASNCGGRGGSSR
jgi:hypothetical protein